MKNIITVWCEKCEMKTIQTVNDAIRICLKCNVEECNCIECLHVGDSIKEATIAPNNSR